MPTGAQGEHHYSIRIIDLPSEASLVLLMDWLYSPENIGRKYVICLFRSLDVHST